MRKMVILLLLSGLLCGTANAAFVTVADWQFANGALTTDSSGNGNVLKQIGVTEGAGGTAVFSGSQTTMRTDAYLDLSAYRQVRVSLRAYVNTDNSSMIFEHYNDADPGRIFYQANVSSPGAGVAALQLIDGIHDDGVSHTNFVWQDIVIEYDLDAAAAADVLKVWIGGTPQADSTATGHAMPGVADAFRSGPWFYIGQTGYSTSKLVGELDYITVEGQVPEPATMVLLGFGSVMVMVRRRRR